MDTAYEQAMRPIETILYVDDEEMACKYFGRMVGSEYEVLTALDADSAIALLQDESQQIDILVTDYRMPGRDGGDLLRQVASEFPHVVRIVVTAYADREVLLDTVNAGEVFRILEKPIDVPEMLEALRLASGLSRVRSEQRQRLMAMDETLAFLAHELNTPLAAIVNFAQGIQRRITDAAALPERQAEIGSAVQAIDDNARYGLDLLASFVESVRRMRSASDQHAARTARQMVEALLEVYPLTVEQRVSIRQEGQGDFLIETLPDCVGLVLSSLLSNALRAVQERPGAEIRFVISVENGPQITIADNGPGIPSQIMARLADDPVTTHEAAGKGWGLVFCKRIMQSFGGSMQLHSVPEEGTVVTLNFPEAGIRRSIP